MSRFEFEPRHAANDPVFPEPTVDDLLADPIMQLLWRRDGINEATVRRCVQDAARNLHAHAAARAAA